MKKLVPAFIMVLLLTPCLALSQDKSGKAELQTVRLIVFSRPSPLILAEVKGFFSREGIRPEITFTRNSTEQMRGIIAGKWDLAQTAADNVVAYVESEGADTAIFAGMEVGLAISLFARPDIKSVKELKGRVLGVDALTTGFTFILRKMLSVKGLDLDRKDYALEAVGGTAQRYQALKDGKVSAVLLNVPWDDRAKKEGFPVLLSAGDVLDSYISSVWVGRRSWAASHPDLMVRFLRAYVAAVDWLYDPANRKEAIALVAKDQHIDEKVAAAQLERELNPKSGVIPQAAVDMKGLQSVIALRAETGLLKPPIPPAEKFCDLTYYKRAVGK